MSNSFQPAGWPTVTPRIITDDVAGLVAFLRRVFGAEGDLHDSRPSEMKIGDSIVMISDGGGMREKWPAFLYVYVRDVDAVHARAVEAGARAIEAPTKMPYGDRRAMFADSWGNLWQVASHES